MLLENLGYVNRSLRVASSQQLVYQLRIRLSILVAALENGLELGELGVLEE
jgi:hypothetical protein